jgi:hypothetical protein
MPDEVLADLIGTSAAAARAVGQMPRVLVGVADLEGPFSIDWEQQRAAFGFSAKPSW